MRRLIKYWKPYLLAVLLAIVLLVIMGNADLALPDYLSRIVNIGIQANGIQDAAPEAIRAGQLENLALFMSTEEQQLLRANYQKVDQASPDYTALLTRYPLLADEPLYLLGEVDEAQKEQLSATLSKPLVIVNGIRNAVENPQQAAALMGELPAAFEMIPPGTDPFTFLKMMPAEQLTQLGSSITERLDTLEPALLEQMAVAAVKSEYEAIGVDLASVQTNYILRTGGIMILLSLLAGICSISVSFLAGRTSAAMARDIRKDVFSKVESFSSQEFNSFSTASLITRSTNDVTQVQNVVFMIIRMAFFAPILGIGGVIRAIDKSPNMWWIIALAVLLLIGFIMIAFAVAVPKFKIIQKLVDRLNLVTREQLSGMMVIRAFNKQAFEEQRFDGANKDLAKTGLFINRVMVSIMPLIMLLMNVLTVVVIWVGAQQIADSTLRIGDMMAFMQYSMQIMFAFMNLSMLFIFLPRAAISGDRIADVLEKEIAIKDPAEPQSFAQPVRGEVVFEDVDFAYPDAEEDILHDISFTAQPGQVTAIIGSTGCGKSTVVNLIPRFYDVTKGRVLLDGIDVRKVRQSELRDQIGYVPQQGNLFSGTIASNLRIADEQASNEEMREALEIAQASEFVFAKDEGMQGEIAQGGSNVSGGQKQRLSIARALVKKPPIFIFDDSFSALDFKTDAALRRALKEKTGDSTVLIVTQRVATVKSADQIVVLDCGRIVGKGTHKELMQTCQAYQEIATSQLSKEELA